MAESNYEKNIFINCPFDDQYQPLFDAIIFTIIDCGYIPRNALEENDSSHIRLEKIVKIIKDCKYSIHDISRTELDAENSLPRFNMPFELGICIGAKFLGTPKQQNKKALILDTERFRYQKYISDIAGQDIKAYDGDIEKIIKIVRDWIKSLDHQESIFGAKKISQRYTRFLEELPVLKRELDLDEEEKMIYADYLTLIEFWQRENS